MPKLKDTIELILYLAIALALLTMLQSCVATKNPLLRGVPEGRGVSAHNVSRPKPGTVEIRSNHHRQLFTVPQDTIIYYGKTLMFIITPGADSFTARYYEDLK